MPIPGFLTDAALCPSKVTPQLHHVVIRELTKWEETRIGTAEQKLELPFWPLEMVSLTASHALNSSLTFIVQVCAFVHMCVCVCVCESRRRRRREKRV